MLFQNGINKEECYGFSDVFGRDKIFYYNSTLRIVGWETPVSIIYQEEDEVKIRFKKTLEKYCKNYEDKPFDGDKDFIFYDKELEEYNAKAPLRRLKYAIEQYKKKANSFNPVILLPRELEKKLWDTDGYYSETFSLADDSLFSRMYDASEFWFPVDVDAIITSICSKSRHYSNDGAIIFYDGVRKHGRVGFDGKFYSEEMLYRNDAVYDIENGIKLVPSTLKCQKSRAHIGCIFLRDYYITHDLCCYCYDGTLDEGKTEHHRNVEWVNKLIKMLYKFDMGNVAVKPYLELALPKDLYKVNIDFVEKMIIPVLISRDQLNEMAFKRFLEVKKLLVKVGFENDFRDALKNIVDLNKSKLLGGSRRNICGENLMKILLKLHKKLGNEAMAELLCNEVELKISVARIRGVKVVEHTVSSDLFLDIRETRRVPLMLKKSDFWKKLSPDTLIIFSNPEGQRYCTVTTSTKAGLGLNRI